MRFGVICEGETDYVAIKEFLGAHLERMGLKATFLPIQPSPDRTDDGGWTRVVFWLLENPPGSRIARFFDGGLFDSMLDAQRCDALLIHLDCDVLDDAAFKNLMARLGVEFVCPVDPEDRVLEVSRIIEAIGGNSVLCEEDQRRHISAPACEASEAWCVAAFERIGFDPDALRGVELWDAFGSVLLRSEGETVFPLRFGPPEKNARRRERFCRKHRNSAFLLVQSHSFRAMTERAIVLA